MLYVHTMVLPTLIHSCTYVVAIVTVMVLFTEFTEQRRVRHRIRLYFDNGNENENDIHMVSYIFHFFLYVLFSSSYLCIIVYILGPVNRELSCLTMSE